MNQNRQRWLVGVLLLVGVVACWWFAFHAGGGKPLFTVGEETTRVTGPVNPDGYVDYVTALNERLGEGVTPENNAHVMIVEAIGPHPEGATMPGEFWEWLGIEEPPEEGDYFVPLNRYLKEHVKVEAHEDRQKILDRMTEAAERPWKPADHPEFAQWLKLNEKPLAVIVEATTRPGYFMPLVPGRAEGELGCLIGALLPSVQVCREVAWGFAARAMLRVEEGDLDRAWQDLLACHRLGRILSRGGTIIETLVGLAIDGVARKADLAYLSRADLNAEQARKRLADLQGLAPFASLADKVDLTERFMALNSVMILDRGEEDILSWGSKPPRRLRGKVNWDPALRNINRTFDRMAAACREKDQAARERLLIEITAEIEGNRPLKGSSRALGSLFTTRRSRGERIGNELLALHLPALDRIIQAEERSEQEQRNLHLAFALAAYHHDTGHYPDSLDKLVPKYLESIPNDLFTDKPLRYRLTDKGYLLYSVGVNGVDDNGLKEEGGVGADDLSVRMPLP